MLRRSVFGGLCLACILSGPRSAAGGDQAFLRGDSNADGRVSVSDALMTRRWLFNGELAPPCLEAANADDDAWIDITDVVQILNAAFLGKFEIPSPFPETGTDPTPVEGLTCDHYELEPPAHTDDLLRFGDVSASPGESVRIPVYLTSSVEVEAFQLVVRYDPTLFTPRGALDLHGTPWDGLRVAFANVRTHPDDGFFVIAVVGSFTGDLGTDPDPECWATSGCFLPYPPIPAGKDQLICTLGGTVSEDAVPGTTIILEPTNGPDGEGVLPPFLLRNELSHRGEARYLSVVPRTEAGALAIVTDIGFFVRGDANSDSRVDVSDALHVFSYLFLGGPDPACPDAADADDSGKLDLTDGVVVLGQLFLGGQISEPYPLVGTDGTADDLGPCARS